ncbi:MAG TPA: AbgT family transporter [Firmicutes bacterium]|nr:AbgT family transporter [Candidatus Fermentithermobacillaceae bacterium]
MLSRKNNKSRSETFGGFLAAVERIGNKLPHPFMLFVFLLILVFVVSYFIKGVTVELPGDTPTRVSGVSLLTRAGFLSIFTDMVKNFLSFPPLGVVLVTMLGVGVADESGLFRAALKRAVQGVPPILITAMIVFVGVNASIAGDAGAIITPVLGAVMFSAAGRNPMAGVVAGYASVNAGVSACLLVGSLDVLLSGITEKAASILPAAASSPTHPLINWYFLVAAVFVLTPVGTWVTEKIILPRCEGRTTSGPYAEKLQETELTESERRGLRFAGVAALAFILLVCLLTVPKNGIMRDPSTHKILPSSPFMSSLVPLLFLFFLAMGLAFGYGSGTIKSTQDIGRFMGAGISGLSGFVVVSFFAAQFIAFFQKSNMATILAVKGTEFLRTIHLTGLPLLVVFVAIVCFINVFMVSSSAKWIILAPVFVPMFAMLGISPAGTLAAYRIADSVTNIISPVSPYLPFLLTMLRKYDKDAGVGTALSLMLPYSIWFAISWTVFFVMWAALGLPLGPGAGLWLQ